MYDDGNEVDADGNYDDGDDVDADGNHDHGDDVDADGNHDDDDDDDFQYCNRQPHFKALSKCKAPPQPELAFDDDDDDDDDDDGDDDGNYYPLQIANNNFAIKHHVQVLG